MPPPYREGEYCIDGRYLSVSLSVCPVLDPTSGHSKLKIGRKEARDPPFRGQRSRTPSRLTALTENQPYLWYRKPYKFQTLYTRMEDDDPHHRHAR